MNTPLYTTTHLINYLTLRKQHSKSHFKLSFIILCFFNTATLATGYSNLYNSLPALSAKQLGVIVNDADPLSRKTAQYYQQQRNIPAQNMIHVSFTPGQSSLSVSKFKQIKQKVDQLTPTHIQAYALTWMHPYRVGCMSITTAFAAGYNEKFCARGCKKTFKSPYFNNLDDLPFDRYKWRPTMALAGENFSQTKALIDRGKASDYTRPQGSAYLLKTSDHLRSTRAVFFPKITNAFKGLWTTHILNQDFITGQEDVMFYFTGMTHIKHIHTNQFLPGAVADHLTSTGGVLSGGSQMSIIEWLKAGATGSYGSVIEPCNFVQKFPRPGIMMHFYLRGNSLIEAYWKSVAWPGQGIFVGEPLAKPFAYPKKDK